LVASFPGVTGVTYGAEWSTTLQPGSWTSIPNTGTGGTNTFSVPTSTHPRMYLRFRVSNP
jgi:hypothetical protein